MLIEFAGDENRGWDFHKVVVRNICLGVQIQFLFLQREGEKDEAAFPLF